MGEEQCHKELEELRIQCLDELKVTRLRKKRRFDNEKRAHK